MDPNGSVWQRADIHNGLTYGYKEGNNDENDLQAYGETQEVKANTRLPYASTLLQTEDAPTAVFVSDTGIPHLAGADYNPGASSMDPNGLVWQRANIHNGLTYGYKEGNNDENDLQKYGDDQEIKANTRIPYASTLTQIRDDINLPTPEGIESMAQQGAVPLDFDFVKTADSDLDTDLADDFMSEEAEKIEVSEDVPKDFHFVHI